MLRMFGIHRGILLLWLNQTLGKAPIPRFALHRLARMWIRRVQPKHPPLEVRLKHNHGSTRTGERIQNQMLRCFKRRRTDRFNMITMDGKQRSAIDTKSFIFCLKWFGCGQSSATHSRLDFNQWTRRNQWSIEAEKYDCQFDCIE